MLIKTKDFELVDVPQEDIITFPDGIYGFEEQNDYVLLKNPINDWLMHLQSVSQADPRFLLIDPFIFFEDYKPELPESVLSLLGVKSEEMLSFFCVAVIPDDPTKLTINLKSPVVINFNKRLGAQVILENSDYSVKTPLFDNERGV